MSGMYEVGDGMNDINDFMKAYKKMEVVAVRHGWRHNWRFQNMQFVQNWNFGMIVRKLAVGDIAFAVRKEKKK